MVKEGQEIFVHHAMHFSETPANLRKYKVVEVMKTIFRAQDIQGGITRSFSKRDLTSKGVGMTFKAYLEENEYWKDVESDREESGLRKELRALVNSLSLEELRRLEVYLKEK